MTIHSYLLFVSSSIVLALVPGPDMAFMLGRCVAQGRRAGVLCALGFNVSGYILLACAVLGLSAILMASEVAFTVIRWLGAAYLVYLGVTAIRRSKHGALVINDDSARRAGTTIFWQSVLTDLLNPKVMLFFFAFLPQFVAPREGHATLQLLVLGITVNMVCLLINLGIVVSSTRLTRALRQNASISKWLERAMGTLFIALGLRLALQKS